MKEALFWGAYCLAWAIVIFSPVILMSINEFTGGAVSDLIRAILKRIQRWIEENKNDQ